MIHYIGSLEYSFNYLWIILQAFILVTFLRGLYINSKKSDTNTQYELKLETNIIKSISDGKFVIIFLIIIGFVLNTYAINKLDEYHEVYVMITFGLVSILIFLREFQLLSKKVMKCYLLIVGVTVINYIYSTFMFGSNITPQSITEWIFDITHFILTFFIASILLYVIGIENQEKKEERELNN